MGNIKALGPVVQKLWPIIKFFTIIWALSREKLSSGFLTKQVSNQSPQLKKPARKLKFQL